MVNLQLTRKLNTPQMFFLPMELKARVIQELKRKNITYQSFTWRDYDKTKYQKEITLSQNNFKHAQWQGDLNRMGALLTNVAPEDMFDLCLQLFGFTMDKEERQLQAMYEAKAKETYLRDYQQMDGTIPVHQK